MKSNSTVKLVLGILVWHALNRECLSDRSGEGLDQMIRQGKTELRINGKELAEAAQIGSGRAGDLWGGEIACQRPISRIPYLARSSPSCHNLLI